MITVTESGLSAPNYALMQDPVEHKTLKLEATAWNPAFASHHTSLSQYDVYSAVEYGGNLWISTQGGIYIFDGTTLTASNPVGGFTVSSIGHITLGTDGTALYAVRCGYDLVTPGNSGIFAAHKATVGGAWTAWAKVGTLPSTTSFFKVNILSPLSGLAASGGGTADGAHTAAHGGDANSTTYWRRVGPFGSTGAYLTWSTVSGSARTYVRFKIRVREFTDTLAKGRTPKSFVLQSSPAAAGVWTDRLTVTNAKDWSSFENREFAILTPPAASTNLDWRLIIKAVNGGDSVEIVDVEMWYDTSEARHTFVTVACAPTRPDALFAVWLDGQTHAYRIERISRSGALLATWTRVPYATGPSAAGWGELMFEYVPVISVAYKETPAGAGEFGILVSMQEFGGRLDKMVGETLTVYNQIRSVLKFFRMANTVVHGSMDPFSDGVDLYVGEPSIPTSSNIPNFSSFAEISNGPAPFLTVVNGRWTVSTSYPHDTAFAYVASTAGYACSVFQSVDGSNWSLPIHFYTPSSGHDNARMFFFGNYAYIGKADLFRAYKPPILGYTPDYVDITEYIIKKDYSQSQALGGQFELDNGTGFFDAHANLPVRTPWLLKISAKVNAPSGASMQIALGLTDVKSFDDNDDSRKLSVSFMDFTTLMAQKIVSDDFHYRDPVFGIPPRDRDSKFRQVVGEWQVDQPSGLLRSVSAKGVAFRVDTSEMRNGTLAIEGSATWRRLVRCADDGYYIMIEGPVGASETFTMTVYVRGVPFYTLAQNATMNTLVRTRIVVRYSCIYLLLHDSTEAQYSLQFPIPWTMRPITYGGKQIEDGMHAGAFGYAAQTADETFALDYSVINGPILTVEDTVKHIAAKSNLHVTRTINKLPDTSGGYTSPMTIVTSSDQFEKINDITVPTGTLPAWTHGDTIDKTISFYLVPSATSTQRVWINYNGIHQILVEFTTPGAVGGYVRIWNVRTGDGIAATVRAGRRFYTNTASRPFIRISSSFQKHVTVLGKNTDGTDAYSWFYTVCIEVDGQEYLTYVDTPTVTSGTTITPGAQITSGDQLAFQAITATWQMYFPKVSSLDRMSDPITIDPNEVPFSAFQRVTEGLRIRTAMRYDGAVAAYSFGDTKARGSQLTITKDQRFGTYRKTYMSDQITDVRLVGAHVEKRLVSPDQGLAAGHRFGVVQNPYMYSTDECLSEAGRVLEDAYSQAIRHDFQTHFIPSLEVEDHITVYDGQNVAQTVIVDNISSGMDPTTVQTSVSGRKSTL
jgi:hypothetical protein